MPKGLLAQRGGKSRSTIRVYRRADGAAARPDPFLLTRRRATRNARPRRAVLNGNTRPAQAAGSSAARTKKRERERGTLDQSCLRTTQRRDKWAPNDVSLSTKKKWQMKMGWCAKMCKKSRRTAGRRLCVGGRQQKWSTKCHMGPLFGVHQACCFSERKTAAQAAHRAPKNPGPRRLQKEAWSCPRMHGQKDG